MTPAAYAALQGPIGSQLSSLFGGGPTYSGPSSTGAALSNAPVVTTPATFSAPMSANEGSILNTIFGFNNPTGGVNPAATSYLNTVLSPQYLSSIMTNPGVTSAISSATAPMVSAFQNTTMPQLEGNFVANGQVLNGPAQTNGTTGTNPGSGQGSSAFDKASAIAETGLQQAIGQTAGGIVNQALNTAMGQQAQGETQAQTLSSTEINNLVTSLQAEALPRLIQQYGMDEGLQQFNNRVQVMLEALGIGSQISGPDTAQSGQSTQQFASESGSGAEGLFNQAFGAGGLLGM